MLRPSRTTSASISAASDIYTASVRTSAYQGNRSKSGNHCRARSLETESDRAVTAESRTTLGIASALRTRRHSILRITENHGFFSISGIAARKAKPPSTSSDEPVM